VDRRSASGNPETCTETDSIGCCVWQAEEDENMSSDVDDDESREGRASTVGEAEMWDCTGHGSVCDFVDQSDHCTVCMAEEAKEGCVCMAVDKHVTLFSDSRAGVWEAVDDNDLCCDDEDWSTEQSGTTTDDGSV
jgi:hypothetical protein